MIRKAKLLILLLIVCTTLSTVSAESQVNKTSVINERLESTSDIIKQLNDFRPAWAKEKIYPDKDYIDYCETMKKSGYISVNKVGNLELSNIEDIYIKSD